MRPSHDVTLQLVLASDFGYFEVRRSALKLPKGHYKCKTCRKIFRYESKNVVRCQLCRIADAKDLRRLLPDLISDQGGLCACCGMRLPAPMTAEIHVDHIYPRSRGGTDERGNLQALCSTCNRRKNASLP